MLMVGLGSSGMNTAGKQYVAYDLLSTCERDLVVLQSLPSPKDVRQYVNMLSLRCFQACGDARPLTEPSNAGKRLAAVETSALKALLAKLEVARALVQTCSEPGARPYPQP